MAKSMRPHEVVRFYVGCPRCLAKPGERCVTVDEWAWTRSNHPERNRRYREIKDSPACRDSDRPKEGNDG